MSEQQGQPWQAPTGPSSYGPSYPGPPQQPAPAYNPGAYGAPVYPSGPAYPGAPSGPPQPGAPFSPVGYSAPRRTDYAHWGRRVGAYLIDQIPTYIGLIIFYVGYGFAIAGTIRSGSVSFDYRAGLVPMLIGWVVMLGGTGWTIYNRWIVGGRTGQSMGRRVMKIRLLSEQTNAPVGALYAFARDLLHVVDSGSVYIGFLWPLWDDKRQTFADKIMTTIVVDAPTAGQPARPVG